MTTSGQRVMWRSILLSIGLILSLTLAAWFARGFIPSYWTLPQNGMYPTLPAGSRFFAVNKPYADVGKVKRGDIVIFEQFTGSDRYIYIWRVVGLPGDSIELAGSQITLNGKPLPRTKVRTEGGVEIFRETNGNASYEVAYDRSTKENPERDGSLTVPENQIFVLGDNRPNARDSRFMGTIPFDSVLAKKF